MKKKIILIGIFIIGAFVVGIVVAYFARKNEPVNVPNADSLPKFTEEQLAPYNGSDLSKPIYIGLNGYVYDVSAGAEYYKEGGSYHYLCGRDSSTELNLIGGDIIKRKYPIVGVLIAKSS